MTSLLPLHPSVPHLSLNLNRRVIAKVCVLHTASSLGKGLPLVRPFQRHRSHVNSLDPVKELVPTKLLSLASGLQPPSIMGQVTTPRTPAFAAAAPPAPPASLGQWRETAAMIIASPLPQDASSALTALGDQLLSYGRVEAAHSWFVLVLLGVPLAN